MTPDALWSLVEQARSGADSPWDTAARLKALLEARRPEEVQGYLTRQSALMAASYSQALWGAAYLINGGCSDDGFEYFRGWLMAHGRAAFEGALADPDSLVALGAAPDSAECEDMIAAAVMAWRTLTGDWPSGPRTPYPELGAGWDFDDGAEMARRYPRLWAVYGW